MLQEMSISATLSKFPGGLLRLHPDLTVVAMRNLASTSLNLPDGEPFDEIPTFYQLKLNPVCFLDRDYK